MKRHSKEWSGAIGKERHEDYEKGRSLWIWFIIEGEWRRERGEKVESAGGVFGFELRSA